MYYISIDPDDPNKLVYYCRNCGNKDSTISVNDITVSKIQLKKSQQEFSHIINKYTKLDPTLPRVSNILCPNGDCLTNKDNKEDIPREIIYIRYDDTNMKYVYLCSTCDTVWKTEDQS
jgi:DNA-directed RNA polymerase subunit M/transcription elongation factor TFIIS